MGKKNETFGTFDIVGSRRVITDSEKLDMVLKLTTELSTDMKDVKGRLTKLEVRVGKVEVRMDSNEKKLDNVIKLNKLKK
ncbi:MAG: hypothetical protein LBC44_03900 [Mycoplasmataceae bacterium]|nr:hypothetical protein [Mycoplasmataceae bacterium]